MDEAERKQRNREAVKRYQARHREELAARARARRRQDPEYHQEWRHRTGRSAPRGSAEHLAKIAARRRPPEERFWSKVEKTDSCWLWTGAVVRTYGVFDNRKAHRVSYEWAKGPVPEGLQVDHLCFVRRCVNPDHLEAVTPGENTRRARVRAAAMKAAQRDLMP